MSDTEQEKASKLGQLIAVARERAGRSVEDCARYLDLPVESWLKVEQGEEILSLPDLEVLAICFGVPLAYFWGQVASEEGALASYSDYLSLRHRIIGALITHARLELDLSVEALSEKAGLDTALVESFEAGAAPVPFFQLEMLASALNVPLDYFSEKQFGPFARHEQEVRMQRNFEELPPQIRSFVTQPLNISYLETAIHLSELDVNRLRGIAESILEITF